MNTFQYPWIGRLLGMANGGVTEPVSFGNFSHCQIWRPSQVNARTSCSPIVIVLTATATVRIAFSGTILVDNDGVKNGMDASELAQDIVQIRSETAAAQVAVSGPFTEFEVPGGVPWAVQGPFLFASLQGITVNPIVTSVGISCYFQWREGIARNIL